MPIKKDIDQCLNIIQSIEHSFQIRRAETVLPASFFEENNRRIYELKKGLNRLEELQFKLEREKRKMEEELSNIQETLPEACRIPQVKEVEPAIVPSEKEIASIEFLADRIGKKIYSDIKSSLSINDRFRFQKDLFLNDSDLMNQTLNDLSDLNSFDEMIDYINEQFSWNDDDESVIAFKDILKTKFF